MSLLPDSEQNDSPRMRSVTFYATPEQTANYISALAQGSAVLKMMREDDGAATLGSMRDSFVRLLHLQAQEGSRS